MVAWSGQGTQVREFVPFDDRWFDEEPPGALLPLPGDLVCVRAADGVFHWLREDASATVIASPMRAPIFAAVPALSSST